MEPQEQEMVDFNHPYTPYDVQNQFMTAAYNVLQTGDGQIGILESPTGTVSQAIASHHRHALTHPRASPCLSSAQHSHG
jgi:hypothetical protein